MIAALAAWFAFIRMTAAGPLLSQCHFEPTVPSRAILRRRCRLLGLRFGSASHAPAYADLPANPVLRPVPCSAMTTTMIGWRGSSSTCSMMAGSDRISWFCGPHRRALRGLRRGGELADAAVGGLLAAESQIVSIERAGPWP